MGGAVSGGGIGAVSGAGAATATGGGIGAASGAGAATATAGAGVAGSLAGALTVDATKARSRATFAGLSSTDQRAVSKSDNGAGSVPVACDGVVSAACAGGVGASLCMGWICEAGITAHPAAVQAST